MQLKSYHIYFFKYLECKFKTPIHFAFLIRKIVFKEPQIVVKSLLIKICITLKTQQKGLISI